MKLVFFLNSASPHQIPYIKELKKYECVSELILVVPKIDSEERKKIGWNTEEMLLNSHIQYLLSPSDQTLTKILDSDETFCFFSGIRAESNVFRWFKFSLNFKVRRYIITEGPYTYHKPLFLHYIRFILQDYKYIKYISGIFAIGPQAVKYYKSLSSSWKVFPFQYVTENKRRDFFPKEGNLKLLFVGNLTKRKNVLFLLRSLKGISNITLTIVGTGKEQSKLEEAAKKYNLNVAFKGSKPMNEVSSIMQQHDVLVLPSLHDGWGAVINEALTLGLFCLVSDKCGAKALIKDCKNGIIFSLNEESLVNALNYCKNNINQIRNEISNRIENSKNISGNSVAEYFINCIKQ